MESSSISMMAALWPVLRNRKGAFLPGPRFSSHENLHSK